MWFDDLHFNCGRFCVSMLKLPKGKPSNCNAPQAPQRNLHLWWSVIPISWGRDHSWDHICRTSIKTKWEFPLMGVPPVIIHSNRISRYKPSSHWGTPMTMEPPKSWNPSTCRVPKQLISVAILLGPPRTRRSHRAGVWRAVLTIDKIPSGKRFQFAMENHYIYR